MRAFFQLTASEFRLFIREPMLAFFGLLFPAVLIGILGCIPDFREANPDLGGQRVIDFYVPIALALAIAMLGLQSIPQLLATYRERGVLRRLATTPASPIMLLGAQLTMAFGTALGAGVLATLVGRIAFGVPLPGNVLLYLLAFLLCGAAVFAVGIFVAAVAPSGKAANGIGTGLFFLLMFFAGLWTPRELMPDWLQRIGELTPLGAGQAAMQAASVGHGPTLLSVVVLLAYAGIFTAGAARFFRWS
ncbi:ABC transporter permease [Actinoplanes sp. NPDC049265]|uniref:ABC transporter permease n=1 Tax=Actinoplanes sp. NPDC049265 TaxID=3363902 RepID=UPI003710C5A4